MNIFVGNLSPEVTDNDLEEAFSKYGKVKSAKVIRDLFSQVSKGFGFVEMYSKNEGLKAIEGLNTTDIKGKNVVINEARPQSKRKSGPRRR